MTMEHNEFSDWTDDEKNRMLNNWNLDSYQHETEKRLLQAGCSDGYWSK